MTRNHPRRQCRQFEHQVPAVRGRRARPARAAPQGTNRGHRRAAPLDRRGIEGELLIDETWPAAEVDSVPAALDKVVAFLRDQIGGSCRSAIGHRVVHGGPDYSAPTMVSEAVLERLERFVPLAPLHQPNNLAPIRAILQRQPQMLQVACFDTAFHRGHPEVADRFAIPEALYAEGVRRYGFHGLSYEYIADRLPEVAPEIADGRVVVAHLGSGASMCAISWRQERREHDGLYRARRAADGHPAGPARRRRRTLSDEREGHERRRRSSICSITIAGSRVFPESATMFGSCWRATIRAPSLRSTTSSIASRCSTGMLAAAMGGIDGFVFTAGIGENAPAIREAVVERLAWLGIELDPDANAKGEPVSRASESRVACYVIPTDEELMIAATRCDALRAQWRQAAEEKRA